MNIQQVKTYPHGFTCVCCKCGRTIGAIGNEKEIRYADLDGEPFKAYYCQDCADNVRNFTTTRPTRRTQSHE